MSIVIDVFAAIGMAVTTGVAGRVFLLRVSDRRAARKSAARSSDEECAQLPPLPGVQIPDGLFHDGQPYYDDPGPTAPQAGNGGVR